MILSTSVKLSPYIQIACLPQASLSYPAFDNIIYAQGWVSKTAITY